MHGGEAQHSNPYMVFLFMINRYRNRYKDILPIQRFLQKIKVSESGCWEWQAGIQNKDGYGGFQFEGKYQLAHRASYKMYIGEIPVSMIICHSCDNPPCVNPFHLFLGTDAINTKDSISKGRRPIAKCPSIRMYMKGCRCEPCVKLTREYWRMKDIERRSK